MFTITKPYLCEFGSWLKIMFYHWIGNEFGNLVIIGLPQRYVYGWWPDPSTDWYVMRKGVTAIQLYHQQGCDKVSQVRPILACPVHRMWLGEWPSATTYRFVDRGSRFAAPPSSWISYSGQTWPDVDSDVVQHDCFAHTPIVSDPSAPDDSAISRPENGDSNCETFVSRPAMAHV